MSTIILNVLRQIPVPIFGSAAYAANFAVRKAPLLPRLAPWAVPFGMGGLWFVWPAVDEEWKGEMGLKAPELKETVKPGERAYRMSALERKVVEGMEKGDYGLLEKEWDAFQNKASNPNDDDDDDEDEDDDEDGDDDESDDSVEENANLKAVRKSQEEQLVLENIRNGDFSSLEADWDAFQIKASNPNDDDDDEDEDDDDEDEEEEEGEEEGEEGGDDEEEDDDDE